jgi:peptidoglycan hydrolase-like protein with peptidoglycan-binding domain
MLPRRFLRAALSSLLSGLLALTVVVTATAFDATLTATRAGAALTGHDDMVYAFGSAGFYGSTQKFTVGHHIVAMAPTASGNGYWLVGEDGAVYSFHAPYYGGISGFHLNAPVVGITATPSGKGYWLVTADGLVAGLGDAKVYGTLAKLHLNSPIRQLVAGPGGKGYWLLGGDGGVFTFGSAKYHGSTGGIRLNKPVVGMTATPNGGGYWLVASDGGIFTFGNASYHGSTGGMRLNKPIIGMARDGSGKGYWLVATDGGVFTFGDAQFKGSAVGRLAPGRHVAQLTGMPQGTGYRMLALSDIPDVAILGPGSTGAAVVDIQKRLTNLGYWLPGINGVFDSDTQQAVWAFQKANSLARTGVIDASTQKAFRTATRPRPRSTSGYHYEVDKTRQIAIVAVNGYAKYIFNTSTGSDNPYWLNGVHYSAHTPEGQFTVIRQVNGPDKSPLGVLYRPKYFTWSGIAVHGYSEVPPYPASHGCTRVSNAAINFIWANNVLPIGTSVWVYV